MRSDTQQLRLAFESHRHDRDRLGTVAAKPGQRLLAAAQIMGHLDPMVAVHGPPGQEHQVSRGRPGRSSLAYCQLTKSPLRGEG
jgi:hypothetical protein